jgi:hypothetical protein
MKHFFTEIKKIMSHEKKKPEIIDMENIVWDSKKDSEKEREYIKLMYRYQLNELYDEKEIAKREETILSGNSKDKVPEIPSVVTLRGKLVLLQIRENIQGIVRNHLTSLMNANKSVRDKVAV